MQASGNEAVIEKVNDEYALFKGFATSPTSYGACGKRRAFCDVRADIGRLLSERTKAYLNPAGLLRGNRRCTRECVYATSQESPTMLFLRG